MTPDEELAIMRYRGSIDCFNENVHKFESHMLNKEPPPAVTIDSMELIKGKCTPEGTLRFKERAVKRLGIPSKNFRRTYPLDDKE